LESLKEEIELEKSQIEEEHIKEYNKVHDELNLEFANNQGIKLIEEKFCHNIVVILRRLIFPNKN